ncbi:TPA: recombinase family protein [Escherichia coli]
MQIGYIRVSTNDQNTDLQRNALNCAGCELIFEDKISGMNRPGFPGECFICELRLPDHRFRWKHNKLFLLLPEEYGPAFPAIVDCYTSPPT